MSFMPPNYCNPVYYHTDTVNRTYILNNEVGTAVAEEGSLVDARFIGA